jgi:AcrR family transcriptional regulator
MQERSLVELRQLRTREAIVQAALSLFDERGFDSVTVTEIAARAGVGRATFFRHFGDKAEVLYADVESLRAVLAAATAAAAAPLAPLGDSLGPALIAARAGVTALVDRIAEHQPWFALRARLSAAHPELKARDLVKHRDYIAAGIEVLTGHGAEIPVATLAAHLAAACYTAAYERTLTTDRPLRHHLDEAFTRLMALTSSP